MRRASWTLAVVGLVAASCSQPDLTGTIFTCSSDADCTGGNICGSFAGARACVAPGSSPLQVGLTAPMQGPSQDLGIEMRRGIGALFKRINDDGGIFGRPLELIPKNDNYDPDLALANVKELLDIQEEVANPDMPDVRGPNSVLALLGNVGTPTMLATAPVANKNGVVYFAPFTGAQRYLRDGTNSPYVFNYRAGYYEETEAMVEYMANFRTPRIITKGAHSFRHILAFTQHDSYGDAGYAGFTLAYNKLVDPELQVDSTSPDSSITRVMYERENVDSVDPAIAQAATFLTALLPDAPAGGKVSVGVVMIDTYQPGNKFIRAIRDWINADAARAAKLDVLFMHVSFVGSDALAQALVSPPATYADVTDTSGQRRKSYGEGVMVTQVVPYYQSQAAGIRDYRTDLARYDGGAYTFNSLEGYIAARLFVQALRENGPDITDANLVTTLNAKMMNVDLGIGPLLTFSPVSHQASHTVWGSVIGADGMFTVPFVWDPTRHIVPGG